MSIKFIIFIFLVITFFSCSEERQKNILSDNSEIIFNKSSISDTLIEISDTVLVRDNVLKENIIDGKGRKQGVWKTYYKNGLLKKKENFKNNLLHGKTLEHRFKDREMWFEENYVKGKKEGYSKFYSLKESEIPKNIGFYKKDTMQWLMFPSCDIPAFEKAGKLAKGIHVMVDSVYVVAPFDNGNTWYEGAFIRTPLNDKKRVGVHKVYYENGKINILFDYTNKTKIKFSRKGDTLENRIFN